MELISLLGGGLLRLVPEFIKVWDRKDERKHELFMQDKAIEFAKIQGQQKISEYSAQAEIAQFDAMKVALEAQGKQTGIKWVDAFNALIRPLIAVQWVIILWPAVIVASFVLAVQAGVPALEALVATFGPDERAVAAGIVGFFFVNRALLNR
jgi:hypothetical protein